MHTQLDNRWDLHVKISESPSAIFISVRPLSFFSPFFKRVTEFLYVRDKQIFLFCQDRVFLSWTL